MLLHQKGKTKVIKDFTYFDEKPSQAELKSFFHKGISQRDDLSEEELTEWANDAGKDGMETSFEQDIDFMTKVISGGLNKQKSTGQTTIPVIAGQDDRMGYNGADVVKEGSVLSSSGFATMLNKLDSLSEK